jgi:Cu/Ag efflux protein CusF
MKTLTQLGAALVAPILLWSGMAFGQATQAPQNPPAPSATTPKTVEGQVVKIDRTRGMVTIRATDGTTHEFQASKETLQGLKEGDRIEARLRQ